MRAKTGNNLQCVRTYLARSCKLECTTGGKSLRDESPVGALKRAGVSFFVNIGLRLMKVGLSTNFRDLRFAQ